MRIPTRRHFLRNMGLMAAALARAPSILAATDARRQLDFVHTHTGERLSAVYFESGAYVPQALAKVNQLLRDFRTETVHPIEPQLLDQLHALQALAGGKEAFQVICGYRSPVTNAWLHRRSGGVAEHSLHMQGRAIDVRLPGCATPQLALLAQRQRRGGVGYYGVSDFVHLDTGAVRRWGDPVIGDLS